MMLAHQGDCGLMTRLSREARVSRRTLYVWRDHAEAALRTAVGPPTAAAPQPTNPRQLLTFWINHRTARGIQGAVQEFTAHGVSLATITAVLHEAGQRAIRLMQTQRPPTMRALALDEISANNRRGAYVNVVDVHSGAVWASEGPLPVDTESWILVLWELQARGLYWDRVVLDGGAAMQAACDDVTPEVQLQGDTWHELYGCAKTQARLQRALTQLERRTPAVAEGTRYLSKELRALLAAVVVRRERLLTTGERPDELAALLALLAELADSAPSAQRMQLQQLHPPPAGAPAPAAELCPAARPGAARPGRGAAARAPSPAGLGLAAPTDTGLDQRRDPGGRAGRLAHSRTGAAGRLG